MNRAKADALAAEYGASIDWDSYGNPYLDAKVGHWFPSNTTHGLNLRPATLEELAFWLDDMERCGSNDCDVCCDVSMEFWTGQAS